MPLGAHSGMGKETICFGGKHFNQESITVSYGLLYSFTSPYTAGPQVSNAVVGRLKAAIPALLDLFWLEDGKNGGKRIVDRRESQ